MPDGREITFNKMNGGRTYPSLVVVARPHLRTRDILPSLAQKERSELGNSQTVSEKIYIRKINKFRKLKILKN